MTRFGPTVRHIRETLRASDRRFSLRQVAHRVGVEPAYLSKIERGVVAPPSETRPFAWRRSWTRNRTCFWPGPERSRATYRRSFAKDRGSSRSSSGS
ncbi:MAG: helix-turn-helix domain-containing protein [Gemmatimonadota bacterium]|nr:helix-turn-helix domain-containing protein [Gemmatimonadota bacterium]